MKDLTLKKLRNYYHYLSAIRDHATISSPYPPFLTIETTAICNLACNKCPVGRERKVNEEFKFMNLALFRKIIDEIKGFSLSVNLSYFGEPLINPNFFEYVQYAKDSGLMVSFYSNGVALDDEIIAGLIKHKVDSMIFSVDCLPEQYQFYSKMKNIPLQRARAHLEKVINNIELLCRRIREANARIIISVIRMDSPEGTPENIFKEFWLARNVVAISGGLMDWGGTVDRIEVTRKRSEKDNLNKGLCSWPYGFVIHSDGYVPLCHMDYNAGFRLGDTKVQTIQDIYNGQPIKDLREKMIRREYLGLPCEKCAYDDYFIKSSSPFKSILIFLLQTKMKRLNGVLRKIKFYFQKNVSKRNLNRQANKRL